MSWQLSQSRAARKAALEAAGYKCAKCERVVRNGKGLVVTYSGAVVCGQCIDLPEMEEKKPFKPETEAMNKDWYAWVYGGARNPQT